MTEQELDNMCEGQPCDCNCMACPLFAKYYRDNNY